MIAAAVVGALAGAAGIQKFLCHRDEAVLNELWSKPGIHALQSSAGHRIAVRIAVPAKSTRNLPVFIANGACFPVSPTICGYSWGVWASAGLAATMATLGPMVDSLAAAGFTVVTYDRYGVGMSDENVSSVCPTVDACIDEAAEVQAFAAAKLRLDVATQRWIMVGPSMGSVVVQAYAVRFPQRVGGFLNLDGFPAPFSCKQAKFTSASKMYTVMAGASRFGLMR